MGPLGQKTQRPHLIADIGKDIRRLVLAPPWTGHVTLAKSFPLSRPQFLHLSNEGLD